MMNVFISSTACLHNIAWTFAEVNSHNVGESYCNSNMSVDRGGVLYSFSLSL